MIKQAKTEILELDEDQILHFINSFFEVFVINPQQVLLQNEGVHPYLINLWKDSAYPDWLEFYEYEPQRLYIIMLGESEMRVGKSIEEASSSMDNTQQLIDELKDLQVGKAQIDKDKAIEIVSKRPLPYLVTFQCIRGQIFCVLNYRKEIKFLINEARSGDPEALIKLTKLDPTFLTTPYSRKILADAFLRNDSKFFEDLSNSLKPDSSFWDASQYQLEFALLLMNGLDLIKKWSLEVIADFLSKLDINSPTDVDTLSNKLKALGFFKRKPYPKRRKSPDKGVI